MLSLSHITEGLRNISPSSTRGADLFVRKIITNHLIYDTIFAAASPASILCLARTCNVAHTAMRDYFTRTFNINRHLTRFFDDPLAFRSLQARTGTLISGSSALQFFERIVYENSDLDLYTPLLFRKDVGRWLLAQGYHYTPNSVQNPDFEVASNEDNVHVLEFGYPTDDNRMRGVAAVFTFHKPSPVQADKQLQVQVIVGCRSPMEVILYFHSTIVLNVISWDRAYSLYPRCTFEHRKAILLRHRSDRSASIIQKYSDRGFEFCQPQEHPQLKSDPGLAADSRWIGDKRSWILELSTEGVTLPAPVTQLSRPLTRDPCYLTTWNKRRVIIHGAGRSPCLTMDFEAVGRVNSLYHEYIVLDEEDGHDPMFQMFQWVHRKWTEDRAQSADPNGLFGYYDQYLIEACEEYLEKREKWREWC